MPSPRTKNGPQSKPLSEVARHLVLPEGIVTTGWPSVRDKCKLLGIAFDPWQDGAGRAILAKRKSGKYAAGVGGVVLSIPRQVGKTFLIGSIVFALCLLEPRLKGIIPAHAGSTVSTADREDLPPDHPRSRGEHCEGARIFISAFGSSPLTRGAPELLDAG